MRPRVVQRREEEEHMRLSQKVALVTGGARGIGAGIARCLDAEGARVGIVDLDGNEAEKTAASLRGTALGIGADVSDLQAITAAMEQVVRELGPLDILVNNAGGGGEPGASELPTGLGVENLTQESWDQQLATNLRTTFATSHAAIPHLKGRGGSIVNIASIAGLSPSVPIPAYGAAKAGVIHLTKTLALELAAHNVRVNAICPGFLWTRAWELLATVMKATVPEYADLEPRQIFLEVVKSGVPLGREQTPEDIGKLVVFLASEDAANITGQEIKVDGGITLRGGRI
jgi:NAD(P)-dependent dehydrogenase (short-subunit alcohol dehydrogenase family)